MILTVLFAILSGFSSDADSANDFLAESLAPFLVEEIHLGNDDDSGLTREMTKILLPEDGIQAGESLPMVVMLHGYSGTGSAYPWYLKVLNQLEQQRFILVLPEGKLENRIIRSGKKNQFWNANNYCCDLRSAEEKKERPVDDIKYLTSVIDHVKANYPVQEDRIYLFGHSNGAMMAYRMACEKSDMIAGIAAYAGTMVQETTACQPTSPVSVLHVHGTEDEVIAYRGSTSPGFIHPGAADSAKRWAHINHCLGGMTRGANLDLNRYIFGKETMTYQSSDCLGGSQVALWKIRNGNHTPSPWSIKESFSQNILDWLFKQRKFQR